jgi:hypothetical protein
MRERRARSVQVFGGREEGAVQWAKFLRLRDDTVAELRAADGDRERIESAIRRYIDQGEELGASPYDLWDFFAISAPGIPDQAGYCGYECEQMVAVFDQLTRERYGE